MTQDDPQPKSIAAETRLTLGLLRFIGEDGNVGQRAMARNLGVAVGLVNAYVKRCIAKGWLKASQVHPTSVSYMLTPRGFMEKAKLTSEYLSQSFSLFREARDEYDTLLQNCKARNWTRIAFYGLSEMSDVALLCAKAAGIEPILMIDPGANRTDYLGVPCAASPPADDSIDAVIVTAMWKLPEVFEQLHLHYDDHRILVPSMMQHLRRRLPVDTPSP
jgi:DNA-binding MarR family transcriptional regulator